MSAALCRLSHESKDLAGQILSVILPQHPDGNTGDMDNHLVKKWSELPKVVDVTQNYGILKCLYFGQYVAMLTDILFMGWFLTQSIYCQSKF